MDEVDFFQEIQEVGDIAPQLIRDHCKCHHCRDAFSGQRLYSISEFDENLEIIDLKQLEDFYQFTLNNGHVVEIDYETIEEITLELVPMNFRGESAKVLWDSESVPKDKFDWNLISDDSILHEMLDQLITFGFAIVANLPIQDRAVLELIKFFGYPRVTNYGDIFEVRIENEANNLAFTSLAIAPHTDNPYRDPVPTIQLLHCLETNVEGGNSGLVDGFRAASILRKSNPEAFEILSTRQFHFEYQNSDTYLTNTSPIIKLDTLGEIIEIRWNDRSMQPPYNDVDIYETYEALKLFAGIINKEENAFSFRLEPGDCVIFDNTRLLHSRTEFASTGTRHLQGAYSDLDGAVSKWHLLGENFNQ